MEPIFNNQFSEILFSNVILLQYEQKHQLSSGAFSSVFCIKQLHKKNKILYAAKYLKASRDAAKREVEILEKLKKCSQVVSFIEVFHCQFYTILVTEYLPGKNSSVLDVATH